MESDDSSDEEIADDIEIDLEEGQVLAKFTKEGNQSQMEELIIVKLYRGSLTL